MHRLVLSGSPRGRGRTASLALQACEAYERAGETVDYVSLAEVSVSGCLGCNACKRNGSMPNRDNLYCVIADSMVRVRRQLNDADALTIVTPVYFAGAPSQLKAFYDRLQPYYWSGYGKGRKRPADLFVIGDGGDPHGFEPLVSETRSALAVAGFRLREVHDWVGRVRADGLLEGLLPVLDGGLVYPADVFYNIGPRGVRPVGAGQAERPACMEEREAEAEAEEGENAK